MTARDDELELARLAVVKGEMAIATQRRVLSTLREAGAATADSKARLVDLERRQTMRLAWLATLLQSRKNHPDNDSGL